MMLEALNHYTGVTPPAAQSFPLDTRRAALLLKNIRNAGVVVKPASKLNVTSDPDDNAFVECAQTAKAHYLASLLHWVKIAR